MLKTKILILILYCLSFSQTTYKLKIESNSHWIVLLMEGSKIIQHSAKLYSNRGISVFQTEGSFLRLRHVKPYNTSEWTLVEIELEKIESYDHFIIGSLKGWDGDLKLTLFKDTTEIDYFENTLKGDYNNPQNYLPWHTKKLQSTNIENPENLLNSQKYKLFQNYPNPFNPSTNISFNLSKTSFVNLCIYNELGQKVCTLLNTKKSKGNYTITWDGRNETGQILPSGVYFYQIKTDDFINSKKMIFLH